MATKPTILPEWNTDDVNRTPPSGAKKALGWILGERPAGGYFNWLAYYTYEWLLYLKEGALVPDVNQSITLSGTGRYKHGDDELQIDASAFQVVAVGAQWAAGTVPEFDGNKWTFSSSTAVIAASVPLPPGKRIKSIDWTFNKNSQAANMLMRLKKRAAGVNTTIHTLTDATNGAAVVTTNSGAINYTVEAGTRLRLEVSVGHNAHEFEGANIKFDHP